ncbi:hypothetical protein PPTG_07572 [Phytophthora nicotianae INRA-310]|uniref:BZIP domain-containing protein n=2 Tax=Phytophthora nicotianae TaxID=4792 RepID=W2QQK8_PHYN3|nr:hypothetical protein PPTG_07572 [Phytophthora nicotianae INRA-310]ETN14545.1 hypothetical protein PPTG_07572 [Phytophthora nicotianae INRA-310]
MKNSTLYPPNRQHLSDNIVAKVFVRSGIRRVVSAQLTSNGDGVDTDGKTQLISKGIQSNLGDVMTASVSSNSLATTKGGSTTTVKQVITSTQHAGPTHSSASSPADVQIKMKVVTVNGKIPELKMTPELVEDLFQLDAKRRTQRRAAQQRYRKMINDRTDTLAVDTQRLKEEITQLELRKKLLHSRIPSEATPWNVVSLINTMAPSWLKEAQSQADFLLQVMSPDVSVNSGIGITALLQEWRLLPQTGENLTVHLLHLDYDETAAMLAKVRVCVTITNETLHTNFPQLVDSSKTFNQPSPRTEKIIGKQIVIPCTVRFDWDCSTAHVVAIRFRPDLITPFMDVLGSLKDVASVLDNPCLVLGVQPAKVA